MSEYSKPYLIIEKAITKAGIPYDKCFLAYKGKRLGISSSEYAVLKEGLLSKKKFDLKKASQTRLALQLQRPQNRASTISPALARLIIIGLREKIFKKSKSCSKFSDLIIPMRHHGATSPLAQFKLYTRDQIAQIHAALIPKENETYAMADEYGRTHLFFKGVEIKTTKNSISPQCWALAAILICGPLCNPPLEVKWHSEEFKEAWRALTKEELPKQEILRILLGQLRIAMRSMGWTITLGKPGRGDDSYEIVECKEAITLATFAPDRAPPNYPAAGLIVASH